jgi:hypothetical protein
MNAISVITRSPKPNPSMAMYHHLTGFNIGAKQANKKIRAAMELSTIKTILVIRR